MQALKNKEINLMRAGMRKDEKKEHKGLKKAIYIAIPVILFIGVAASVISLKMQTNLYEKMAENERELLASSDLLANQQREEELQKEISIWKNHKQAIDQAREELSGVTELEEEAVKEILNVREGNITITDISYNGGIVSITASGVNYTDPTLFTQRLKKQKAFSYVDYTGFVQDETGYVFTISASLKQEKGGSDDE